MVMNLLNLLQFSSIMCYLIFILASLFEIMLSIFSISKTEHAQVTCVDNDRNKAMIKNMPTLKEFKPVWWGKFGRTQTILSKVYTSSTYEYTREVIQMNDGIDIALDWKENAEMNALTPIVVCLHTLGGDSSSTFIKRFTDDAVKRKYRAVVYNRRGHGGMSLLPRDYDSNTIMSDDKIFPRHCDLDDLERVVNHIQLQYPEAQKFLVGFSCGANLAINYISKHVGIFKSCISISNGYDIHTGVNLLVKNSPICDGIICQTFKKLIYKNDHLEEIRTLMHNSKTMLDLKSIRNTNSLKKLEEMFISLYGFDTLEDYYDHESCKSNIYDVKVPLLCLSNMDDPFLHNALLSIPRIAAETNDKIITVITKRGGHIGWIESIKTDPWYSKVVFEYLNNFIHPFKNANHVYN
jgi:predicted alpha/beta-fold hydrolase